MALVSPTWHDGPITREESMRQAQMQPQDCAHIVTA
jgi:hypothetical protein